MTKRFFQETFMNDEAEHSQHISLVNRPIVKCRNLASRFEALRLQLSNVQYYDPFQKEQQSEEEEYCVVERPTKRQRSIVSTIVDSVMNGLLYSAASVYEYVWAESVDEKYREKVNARTTKKAEHSKQMRGQGVDYNQHSFFNMKQQDESSIRDTFLRTQRAAFSKNNKRNSSYYTTVNSARRPEETWGLVDKKSYNVDFLLSPPTKPPRHVPVQSLGLFGNQVSPSATM